LPTERLPTSNYCAH